MARIAYVNGEFIRLSNAAVRIEDRGYQFADGIYEVCLVINGEFWDRDGHMARMRRSLSELKINFPVSDNAIGVVIAELLRRNRLTTALVYIQISRGVSPRNHPFPNPAVEPALVMTARRFNINQSDAAAKVGASVITHPDIRWGRVDIKTVGLLPNVLAKQAAREAGAIEAWLVRDSKITEGSSSNAWIVAKDGTLITHPKNHEILGGITRDTAMACAQELQIKVEERPFTVEEACGAAEAFISSATNLIMPIVKIDSHQIGDGAPGPISLRLRGAYKKCAPGR
ncbi:MAG: D-amino-acid transaminase [Marinicaulis sp.]|nr:D-amino-acid transaminase [Marinicaulis sp.]NNE42218.1 D-amino-acid transaminase [Marinicaulis sp.]NNL89114.1 D-amino-acid transaminase [Marinicaulis sp.]